MKKTLKEQIQQIAQTHNAKTAGRIVDYLRFKHGLSYDDCAAFFERCAGINKNEFEDLMYYADMYSDI